MDRLDCDRMFVAVIETGSFAAAARRLGSGSGQASKLVSRLESVLGVRLLNRSTRAVSATEVGQAYFERVRALLEDFGDLDQSVRDASQAPRGKLRLTAPLTFGTVQLVPALNDFARRYPEISLDVQFSDRVVSLVDEGFDAAIRVGHPADTSLIARKLCESRVLIVASGDYLAEHGMPQHPDDLTRHDCIIDSNFRDPAQWRFQGPEATMTVAVQGRLWYSNAEACLCAAKAGLGIAHVPEFVAARSLATGQVQSILHGFEEPPHGVYALYPPGRHLAAKVRVLVDFLANRYHGTVDWGHACGLLRPFQK
ncbi:MAG: LysR family transcriptional regulator [Paracoccaceae bacterium]|nr:LysR family transcriptional regulator [Paracoccaceae bacterium]